MNTNKLKFKTIEEQDEYIQNLSLDELKKFNENSTFIFKNDGRFPINKEEEEDEELIRQDEIIQNMPLDELKKFNENSTFIFKNDGRYPKVKSKK